MRVFAVGAVIAYLREVVESDPRLVDIWLTGEVSTLSRSAAGHIYFTLKDQRAQLRCVMFRADVFRGGDLLHTGAQILAFGRVSLYPERGELQFICSAVQPEGIGVHEAEFRRLHDKLAAEGLFDEARKRPLPAYPRRIGVVTSPTGAVWRDIVNIIARRWPLAELVLAPTTVQGELAVRGVVAALRRLEQERPDVILLARGGGAAEELWPFNDEAVVRAIYASPIPVVSAVGHEADVTLADYAADRRAPTPSAAAELITPDRSELARRAGAYRLRAAHLVQASLQREHARLAQLARRLARHQPDFTAERRRARDLLASALVSLQHRFQLQRERVTALALRAGAISPLATLQRGYALVRREPDELVRSTSQVSAGDRLSIQVSDGLFGAQVTP